MAANILSKRKNDKSIATSTFDLNKTCLKDEFTLLNIDMLVDTTVGHLMVSFIDGFNDYNLFKMDHLNAKKIAFRTPMDNFHYTLMSFDLNNAGATYE